MPISTVKRIKTEPFEDDDFKIELIEHQDDIQTLTRPFRVRVNRSLIRNIVDRVEHKIEPPADNTINRSGNFAATNNIISHDIEFFERNNIEMDIKIEETTI